MSAWQAIVAAALVGTERTTPQLEPGGALAELLRRLEAAETERRLCQALAAAGTWQRAGRLPARDPQPLPEPCEADHLHPCTPAAAHHLATMLAGTHAGALPEWLAAAFECGVRAPEALLPELLDMGRRHANHRLRVAQVAGARGQWLAQQNPDWAYLAAETAPAEELWQVGGREARAVALGRLRREDPARARALLEESWPSEPPEHRAAFLSTLAEGLSMEDEPLLESLLDDRRKEVRQAAAWLLRRLPESRLSRRMIERLRPLIRPGRRRLGFALDVTPPERCDREMARDDVGGGGRRSPMAGERAAWLCGMLAASPLAAWSDELGRSPTELVRAACQTRWREDVLLGWSFAAVAQRDPIWAEALLRECVHDTKIRLRLPEWPELTRALPADRVDALLAELIQESHGELGAHPALPFLHAYEERWGALLSRAVLEQLRREAASGRPPQITLRQLLQEATLRMIPEVAGEAVLGWPTGAPMWTSWEQPVNEFLATLTFRRDMLKELSP
jgi:hypothetical protein